MTIRAKKFDPEVMLGAPRRGAGVPNDDASLVLYSVSRYDFTLHKDISEVRVLNTETMESKMLTNDGKSSSPTWINAVDIAMLRSTDEGTTELVVGKLADFKTSCYVVETIDAAASELKVVKLEHDLYGIAFSAPASPDGSLFNVKKQPERVSSGKLYRSLYVRHWDHWITSQKNSVWYAELFTGSRCKVDSEKDKYYISPLVNALKGSGVECPIDQPGRAGDFDIGKGGIVYISKHPDFNPALNTICSIYVIPLTSFRETNPTTYTVDMSSFGMAGAIVSPSFAKNGRSLAFLMMSENGYEADKNHIFMMPDINRPAWLIRMLNPGDFKCKWDRSPQTVTWNADGKTLYVLAENHGRSQLWSFSSNPFELKLPTLLHTEGSITDVQPLANGAIFVSGSSFIDNGAYYLFDTHDAPAKLISSNSHQGGTFGLSQIQIDEIWFKGADDNLAEKNHLVHAWLLKPSNFKKNEKYPLAFLVHGGPQGSWLNSWATRWNPAVYAEQGYVVVCPNPTGSTGYGQAFCDSIKENWGGIPYEDLVRCFEYVEKHLDYVDTTRAVALGASYGGYMMNWMQGHPLGKKFKAMVCHDGIFSTVSSLSTEELYFPIRDLGGPWSEHRKKWLKWDPAQHTQNWTTPMLVIHSDHDYRLTIGEGLAAFNILQSQGVHSEFLTFPDENHFVLKPENALTWYIAIFNFINPYVGLPAYRKEDLNEIIQDPALGYETNSRIVLANR